MSRLRKFLLLTAADRWLLIKAALLLQMVSVGMWLLPFRTLRGLLDRTNRGRSRLTRTDQIPVTRITWAIEAASRHMPGHKTCLAQALSAQVLLSRRGYPAVLRIGVAKEGDQFRAHAWVESEGKVVIGGHDLGRYAPLAALEVERP